MRIAQLSVAGEEHTRPDLPESPPDERDRQALDEYACDRSNLPWVIFRAAHRANHVAALPARARALLAALARTVDANRPDAAIFARRDLLTGRALQSMRTFYRSLDDLETGGLITRPPQTRYGAAGLFGRAYLHLTPKAADLLGLVESRVIDATPTSSSVEDEAPSAPGHSLTGPSVTLADGAIYKDLSPTNQKRQPGRLPADLERLRALGFRDFLIFKLMGEASRQAKRLSDVVEATWEHLKRASHPISYLRTLLRAPVDFAYRVRTLQASTEADAVVRERHAEAHAAAGNLAGRIFVSRDQTRTYGVATDAQSVTVQHRDEPRPRVHAGRWIPDFLAALRDGHILPAPSNVSAMEPNTPPPVDRHATRSTESASHTKGRLDDLKQFLRKKQAGVAEVLPSLHSLQPAGRTDDRARPHSYLMSLGITNAVQNE